MTAPVEVGMRVYVLTHHTNPEIKLGMVVCGESYIRSIHATESEAKAVPLGPGHSPECCSVQGMGHRARSQEASQVTPDEGLLTLVRDDRAHTAWAIEHNHTSACRAFYVDFDTRRPYACDCGYVADLVIRALAANERQTDE